MNTARYRNEKFPRKPLYSVPVIVKPRVWAERLAELYGSAEDAFIRLLDIEWDEARDREKDGEFYKAEVDRRYRRRVLHHLGEMAGVDA